MLAPNYPLTLSLSKGEGSAISSFDKFRTSGVGLLLTILCAFFSFPAHAQHQTVVSDGPSSVSVTVYRNPNRNAEQGMNLSYLGGYALITEQRTINLPAGAVDLRFEGVAGGIIPQSAIVTGLSDGVLEKNRDAALLSPSALLNGHLGRRVTIRRTSAESGKTQEFDADIRTDASGGMVIETAEGFEALKCTGLNEAIIYPGIPEGLSAKPTLSVKSVVRMPTSATVTLSYLATGFDWQANYVADVADDGETLNLFSWVTLANGDETSFLNARTQTVAGQPNKGRDNIQRATGGEISLRCWPSGTTTTDLLRRYERARRDRNRGIIQEMPVAVMAMEEAADSMIVTAKKVEAKQEDLGDLKLYRIPVPVTVASQSQKQVAMFEKSSVRFDKIYSAEIWADNDVDSQQFDTVYRFQNEKRDGLGLPLPAGKMIVFQKGGGARLLLGEGSLGDKTIGEEIDVTVGETPVVRYSVEDQTSDHTDRRKYRDMKVTLTNASSRAARVEIIIAHDDDEKLQKTSKKLRRKNGKPIWRVSVPANGEKTLSYRLQRQD